MNYHSASLQNVRVIHILGFQTKDVVFYEEKFAELGDTYVATVDGTHGTKGFVTDVIDYYGIDFDILYSCGVSDASCIRRTLQRKSLYFIRRTYGLWYWSLFRMCMPLTRRSKWTFLQEGV